MDLTIEGNAYVNGAFHHCCIGIEQGKITAVKKVLKAEKHIDVGNRLILPGGIDLHVHFRDPGFTEKEDFFTGSQAAAFGGITCVCDMPNTKPQTITSQSLHEKIQLAESKSIVDFGVYAGVTDANISQISELSKHCSGFKIYLGSTTNALQLHERQLPTAFKEIAASKKIVLLHAESEQCLQQHKMTELSIEDHLRAHPASCEEIAIQQVLTLAQTIPTRVHLCHLSSCEGFELLKKRPPQVSVGVTPHHLLLTLESIQTQHTFCKVNPPIRTRLDRETLWQGVTTGVIDVLESDHAPHTLKEKEVDFDKAPSGIPGVETMYPLLLAAVKHDRLSFQRLIPLLCEKPAELLTTPKGRIETGNDADLIIVNFKNVETISEEQLHSRCGWTPFEGWPAIFPEDVFLRGESIIEDNILQASKGFGRCIGG